MSVRMFKIVFMCWGRVIVTVQLCNRYIGGGEGVQIRVFGVVYVCR